ncbi:MAG TPA: hypothetical protein VJV04_12615 [Nitrospiraceae bacterium]|nr:hypothetical protein [Nitrospiraceae bacterium]
MAKRFVFLLFGSVVSAVIGSIAVGCTTHTHERPESPPATVIHEDMGPSSSTVREGAREGAREGVRDSTRY